MSDDRDEHRMVCDDEARRACALPDDEEWRISV